MLCPAYPRTNCEGEDTERGKRLEGSGHMSAVRVEKKIHDKDWKRLVKEKRASPKIDVAIGKKGLTPGVIEEIKRRLEKEGVVKVRIHKAALVSTNMDRVAIAVTTASLTGARLIEVRGRTFILVSRERYKS